VRAPGSDRLVPATRRDEEGLPAKPQDGPQAIAERLLALATLEPHSERVVRRAWRSAQRLDADLDVLVVRPSGRAPSEEDRKRLEALRRLCAMLGARLHVEEGDDVAAVAIGLARSLGSTYVLLGTPSLPKGLRRFGAASSDRALPMRLLRGLPGVDIRVIADPALRGEAGEANGEESEERSR
jgi:two-component system, OmpR family, sensor histidine kinase KdpD